MESWVAFDVASGRQVIFSKSRGPATSDGISYALWLNFGTLNGQGRDTGLSATFSPVPGRWYHLAYTMDSTKQQVLYIDGIQVASGSTSSPLAYAAQPLLLGCEKLGGIQRSLLHGRIDEAAIYNRALSGAEITSIFNAGAAGKRL